VSNVALYVRISKDRSGRAEGVAVQERYGRAYAAVVWPGLPVVVYSDNDLSAAEDDVWRPGYEKLREDLAAGAVSQVWAIEQYRLQRREIGWFELAAELVAAGIDEVHTRRDGIVRVGDEIAGIKAVLAAAEVRRMKKRVHDRLDDNAARGLAPGSVLFGYRHVPAEGGGSTYAVVPAEADAIREAAVLVLAGWSLTSVAAAMRARGLAGVRGAALQPRSVRNWLTRPTVAGWRVHRGVITGRGAWEPILDEDTWQACRARLSGPRTVTRSGGGAYPVGAEHTGSPGRRYLLSGGLIRCGVCDAPMAGSIKQLKGGARRGGRDVPYYVCHPAQGGRSCTGVSLEPVEAHVTGELFARLDKPEFLDAIAEDAHAARRDEITTALSAVDGRRASLAAAWGEGGLSSAEWQAARGALADREAALRAELADKRPPPARDGIAAARAAWPKMTLGEQREFLRMFIAAVTVSRATQVGGRSPSVDLGRVAITWRRK
jgi:DNA invertase Pin-like site-specific DNA recombinase